MSEASQLMITIRMQALERAKAELRQYLHTFWGDPKEKYEEKSEMVNEMIKTIEDELQ